MWLPNGFMLIANDDSSPWASLPLRPGPTVTVGLCGAQNWGHCLKLNKYATQITKSITINRWHPWKRNFTKLRKLHAQDRLSTSQRWLTSQVYWGQHDTMLSRRLCTNVWVYTCVIMIGCSHQFYICTSNWNSFLLLYIHISTYAYNCSIEQKRLRFSAIITGAS